MHCTALPAHCTCLGSWGLTAPPLQLGAGGTPRAGHGQPSGMMGPQAGCLQTFVQRIYVWREHSQEHPREGQPTAREASPPVLTSIPHLAPVGQPPPRLIKLAALPPKQ